MIIFSILIFLLIFSFLIIVHELGHYWAAVRSGVRVEEFGVGFGPKVFGLKRGETEFTLNAFPLGGFVRMLGEEGGHDDPRSFAKASLVNRMWITVAGVIMNFLSAIILLTVLFTVGTQPILVSKNDVFRAAQTGQIQLTLEDGSVFVPENINDKAPSALKVNYQVKIQEPVHKALVLAITETARLSKAVVEKVAQIPVELIEKRQVPEGLAGPVGIAEITHRVVPQGFWALVKLAALLSISLGVMNLLPIPALDGGRLVFQFLELLGKPFGLKPNETWENYAHIGGFVFLMGIFVLITWHDIMRIFFS